MCKLLNNKYFTILIKLIKIIDRSNIRLFRLYIPISQLILFFIIFDKKNIGSKSESKLIIILKTKLKIPNIIFK
jgi:hypothetical protein